MTRINNTPTRYFGLDLFRATAIILVVLGHSSYLLSNTRFEGFPYIRMIDGVDMFFVLSGYLIGNILLNEMNSTENFGFRTLRKFWVRRWLRTLPNYYLILLVNYLIIYFNIIKENIHQFNWKFLLFLQNFATPFYGFFWESWSLSVEEWFYVFTPLLLLLLSRFIRPKTSFMIVTILMIIIPIFYRIHRQNPAIDDFWFDVTFRKVVVARLDSIAYGLLAAWFYYYFNDFWKRFKMISLLLGIALIIFIVNFHAPNNSFYKQVIYFSITPISAMLLLPFAQGLRTIKGVVAHSVTHISKISYSMYLINLAVVSEVIRDNFLPTTETGSIITYVVYWLIVLIGSTILYRYFEKPWMNLRDK